MKRLESDWRELAKEEMTNEDILDFLRLHSTLSIDINADDPEIQHYVKKHPNWIKEKKPGN